MRGCNLLARLSDWGQHKDEGNHLPTQLPADLDNLFLRLAFCLIGGFNGFCICISVAD
jgi:hypothetical protein